MEPPIGYVIGVSFHLPRSPISERPPGRISTVLGVMGLYENWVLPRLLDLAMRNHVLNGYRRRTIKTANGLVLEIGVGSGLNLSLYGSGCRSRPLVRIAASGKEPGGTFAYSGVARPGIGAACSVRRRGLRCRRDDLDIVLDPESDRRVD